MRKRQNVLQIKFGWRYVYTNTEDDMSEAGFRPDNPSKEFDYELDLTDAGFLTDESKTIINQLARQLKLRGGVEDET